MAWTAPKTWSVGETLTAANFNTHVRDNSRATWREIARKSVTQSVTSSTVLVNDDALFIPVTGTEVWAFEFRILCDGASAGDIKTAFTFPASGDLQAMGFGPSVTDVTSFVIQRYSTTTSPTATVTYGTNAANDWMVVTVKGVYINGGTGGNLQFQWAQAASSGTATRVKANSQVLGQLLV